MKNEKIKGRKEEKKEKKRKGRKNVVHARRGSEVEQVEQDKWRRGEPDQEPRLDEKQDNRTEMKEKEKTLVM